MSKDYLFTKKGKNKFNKLSEKDKQAVANMAITDAVNKVMREKITESMIAGMRLQIESLYQKHVQEIDKLDIKTPEWLLAVEQLMSTIRLGRFEYEKISAKKEEADGSEV